MRVTVTQEHIDNGLAGNPNHCPIAQALKEMGHPNVSVTAECASVWHTDEIREFYQEYTMPDNATRFVQNFDEGLQVEPLSFVLTAIP